MFLLTRGDGQILDWLITAIEIWSDMNVMKW